MKWLVLAAVALLLQACGGGGSSAVAPAPPPVDAAACPVPDQRASLRSFMNDQYFWYANLAAPDERATSMDAYFQSMLYQPKDRYSFTQPSVAFNQIFTDGRRIGYGYTVVWADAGHTTMRVRNVEPRSPVAQAGLARGDIIVSIDGYSPDAIAAGQAGGPVTDAGIDRTFVVRNGAGVQRVLRVQSADYPLTPVAGVTTLDAVRGGAPVKVGFIAYTQFVQYSSFDLYNAFVQFAQAGADELILDLRYNGGGSVAVSRDLASMIGGDRTSNLLYAYLRFNDKNRGMNTSVVFNTSVPDGTAFPLPGGMPRLIVIGSAATASASELIINGLRPFMPVVLIGETTYGKPYGFLPRDNCGTIYNAVQFTTVNSLKEGNYDTGFTPDCAVADDFDHALGDPAEARIHAALGYIETGRCPAAPQAAATGSPLKSSPVFGDTVPPQMFMNPGPPAPVDGPRTGGPAIGM
jgi:carboxyl-terminal processing protease